MNKGRLEKDSTQKDIGRVQTLEFNNQRSTGDPPAGVIGAEETNVLEWLSEPKSERGEPRLLRRPR